jgi:UDP:flavonoid glycosyltransferase YjiC (YdhE family)
MYARLPAASAQGWLNRGIGWLVRTIVEHEAGRVVNPYRATLGLLPELLLQPRGHLVGLFPEWFGPRAPDWPSALVLAGFPLNDTRALDDDRSVEGFLGEGSAPIVFTLGTGMVHVRPILDAAVDACRRLDRRGILLTRYLDQVPDRLPESVRHFPYVELGTLLPRAVALVHHGGIGTCARGLAAGVPQVILPYGFDQFDNMARLERLGVGSSTPRRGVTGRALARTLRPLIETPSVTARARALAERLRGANGIDVACDAIERVASSGV